MDNESSPASSFDAFRDLERYLSGQVAANAGLPELERESERRGREILRLALQVHSTPAATATSARRSSCRASTDRSAWLASASTLGP